MLLHQLLAFSLLRRGCAVIQSPVIIDEDIIHLQSCKTPYHNWHRCFCQRYEIRNRIKCDRKVTKAIFHSGRLIPNHTENSEFCNRSVFYQQYSQSNLVDIEECKILVGGSFCRNPSDTI